MFECVRFQILFSLFFPSYPLISPHLLQPFPHSPSLPPSFISCLLCITTCLKFSPHNLPPLILFRLNSFTHFFFFIPSLKPHISFHLNLFSSPSHHLLTLSYLIISFISLFLPFHLTHYLTHYPHFYHYTHSLSLLSPSSSLTPLNPSLPPSLSSQITIPSLPSLPPSFILIVSLSPLLNRRYN